MKTEQTTSTPPTVTATPVDVSMASAPTVTPAAPRFVPPRLTKKGKVATVTQGGLGGSIGFP